MNSITFTPLEIKAFRLAGGNAATVVNAMIMIDCLKHGGYIQDPVENIDEWQKLFSQFKDDELKIFNQKLLQLAD